MGAKLAIIGRANIFLYTDIHPEKEGLSLYSNCIPQTVTGIWGAGTV